MKKVVKRYIAFAARHAGIVTLFFALLLVGEIFFLRYHFRLDTDLRALFSGDNETVRDIEYLESRIGTSSNVQVIARSESFEQNVRFLSDLRDRISSNALIRFVELERDISYLEEHALLLLPQKDLDEAEQKIREIVGHEVTRALSLDDEAAPQEEEGETLSGRELEAEIDRVLERIEAHKKKYDISRYFTAAQGRYVEMKVRPTGKDTDITTIKKVISYLDREVAALDPKRYGIEVEVGGYYRHRVQEIEEIRSNVIETIGLCITFLIAVTLFFFRAWQAIPIIFFPLSLGVATGIVTVQYLVGTFNLISAFSFAMLYGLGIDYAIHSFSRYLELKREGLLNEAAMQEAFSRLVRPLLSSMVTTATAFFTLFFIEFRGFSDFGLVAGVGIVCAFLMTMLVLPPFVLFLEQISPIPPHLRDVGILAALFRAIHRHRMTIILPTVFTILGAVALFFVQFEYNLDNLSFKRKYNPDSIVNQYIDLLRSENKDTLSVSMPSFYLTNSKEEARVVAERLYRMKEEDTTSIHIRGIFALSNFVPSRQEEKIRSIAQIRRLIERKKEILPPTTRLRVERDIMPLLTITEPIVEEKLPDWIRDKLSERDGSVGKFVMVMLTGNKSDINRVLDIKREFGVIAGREREHKLYGSYLLLADIKEVLEKEAPLAVFAAFSAILFLLLLTFRSFQATVVVYLPLIAGTLWMIGIMVFCGIKVNLFNMVILPTIIGIGIDASIHLYSRFREEGPVRIERVLSETGRAVLFSVITTLIGFLSLLYGAHKGIISIGIFAAIGMVTVTTAELVFFPVLLYRWYHKK